MVRVARSPAESGLKNPGKQGYIPKVSLIGTPKVLVISFEVSYRNAVPPEIVKKPILSVFLIFLYFYA